MDKEGEVGDVGSEERAMSARTLYDQSLLAGVRLSVDGGKQRGLF